MSVTKYDLNVKVWIGYKHQLSNNLRFVCWSDKFHSLYTSD